MPILLCEITMELAFEDESKDSCLPNVWLCVLGSHLCVRVRVRVCVCVLCVCVDVCVCVMGGWYRGSAAVWQQNFSPNRC